MNLWVTRDLALQALRADMAHECEFLDRAFQQLEYLAQRLGGLGPETPFTRITALITAKARNLAQACYSLALDGLGQESGAVVRVWVEATELLTYVRRDPDRTNQILNGRLPSAGDRARLIGSSTQRMRSALSRTASHISFGPDSWLHIINARTGQVRTRQEFRRGTLGENLGTIFALLVWTIKEAALCLDVARGSIEEGIVLQMDQLRRDGIALFHLDKDIATPIQE